MGMLSPAVDWDAVSLAREVVVDRTSWPSLWTAVSATVEGWVGSPSFMGRIAIDEDHRREVLVLTWEPECVVNHKLTGAERRGARRARRASIGGVAGGVGRRWTWGDRHETHSRTLGAPRGGGGRAHDQGGQGASATIVQALAVKAPRAPRWESRPARR